MALALNLTPAAIIAADYDVAQAPTIGAENEVYLSPLESLLLGIIRITASVQAAGTLTATANFANLETVTIDTKVYTFQTTLTNVNGNVAIGATLAISITNLQAAINLGAGSGTAYAAATTAHPTVTCTSATATTLVVTAIAFGTSGNSIASTETSTIASWGGATLSGGTFSLVYEHINVPIGTTDPVVACVLGGDLKADAAPVITMAGLTGTFAPATYAQNATFNFGATRAVEIVGTQTTWDAGTLPTVTNAKAGARIALIQLPVLSTYRQIGVTTGSDIDVPSKTAKTISAGFDSSRYVKQGRTKECGVRITARDLGPEDGIRRFIGSRCTGMVSVNKEEKLVTHRQFFTNLVVSMSNSNPDADEPSTLEASGMAQHMITLVAPGS